MIRGLNILFHIKEK